LTRLIKFALTCGALIVALAATACGLATIAAPSETYALTDAIENTLTVEKLAKTLQEKYGVFIQYPTVGTEYGQSSVIFPQTLKTLDAALSTVTPEMVRQVSEYYYDRNGRHLTFTYTSSDLRGPYGYSSSPEVMVGSFDGDTSQIELYIPLQGGQAIATGDNPLTILHEFAHAVQFMLANQIGYARMEQQWNSLMDGAAYGQSPADPKIFITQYAAVDFEEDFAETFSYIYMCNRPGLGFSHRLFDEPDAPNPLGKKAAYIERLIARHFTEINASLENYRKIYSTPASVNKLGVRLSGPHLLFIGMEEPRTVPLMLLTSLDVNEPDLVWLSEIGGWYCQDASGNHLLLFPNGTFGRAGKNVLEDAIAQNLV